MDDKPKRRWFRFRLSTVLILTAIAAWAMAMRPYFVIYDEWEWTHSTTIATIPPKGYTGGAASTNGVDFLWTREVHRPNPSLALPALTLIAFLAWKAAWMVVERRRRAARAAE